MRYDRLQKRADSLDGWMDRVHEQLEPDEQHIDEVTRQRAQQHELLRNLQRSLDNLQKISGGDGSLKELSVALSEKWDDVDSSLANAKCSMVCCNSLIVLAISLFFDRSYASKLEKLLMPLRS